MNAIKLIIFSVLSLLVLSVNANAQEASIVLQLRGDSGSSIAKLNSELKKNGSKLLPSSVELTSKMTSTQIQKIKDDLDALVDKASPNEMIETSAYGEVINGKTTCFKGDNKKVSDIYANMVDIFVSDQFSILATATKQADRVGIKYDSSDSGSEGAWINIVRCK